MGAIRLIVSDLDGTLLAPDHMLQASVVSTIRDYVSQGGLFTLATGRPFITARPIVEQLGLELPVILCNGAVLSTGGGHMLERYGMPAGEIGSMLKAAHEAGLNVLMFRGDEVQTFRLTEEIAVYKQKEKVACSLVPLEGTSWRQGDMEKAVLLGPIEMSRAIWAKWAPQIGTTAVAFQSEVNYLELVPGHVSKGTALVRLAGLLGVRTEEVMAIGNQLNDLPMLEAAGIGVAVANSPDLLKEAADYVCRQAYGEGVVEAIDYFVYGGGRKHERKRDGAQRIPAEAP